MVNKEQQGIPGKVIDWFKNKRRFFLGLLITLVVLSLIGGLLSSFISDEGFTFSGFIKGSIGSFKSILWWMLILLSFVLVFYVPPIVLIRKWWKRYRKNHVFKNSQNEKSINRLLKNATALFGFVTIFYAIFIATFAYLIAPDSTTDANNQINELSLKDPGFEIDLLEVRNNREAAKNNLFKRILSGTESNHKSYPINSYWFHADSIYVERYTGSSRGDTLGFQLADVVHPLSFKSRETVVKGDQIDFTDVYDQPQTASIKDLQRIISDDHIKQKTYHWGTDNLGRDYLSRTIIGVRVSISVGVVAVLIALLIGIPMGSIGGFFRGKLDDAIMWLINVFWSIPTLLLVFPLIFALGYKFWTIYVAVGLTMWVDIARIVRGQVLSVRELEYVEAAKSFGFSNFRTIFFHILPNISGPIIVITAANFAYAILIEAGLSFLGIGVQPPKPSWGLMISKHKDYIATGDPHLALIPGFAIVMLVLAFFLIGNGLRDALDAKTKIDH